MVKHIAIVSDLHVGHRLAVMPPDFVTQDGMTIGMNRPQEALYALWERVTNEWNKPDILVINGEPIDGQQPRNLGVETWTTDYIEQCKAAKVLIEKFRARRIYLTRGSNYHVQIGGVSIEELFGEMIGSEKIAGNHVLPELFLDVEKVHFNFAHHISSSISGWQYRSTPSAKEAMLMKLNENHKYPADIIIRSHVHYYWYNGSTSHLAMTTPAWQLQTWFGYRKTSAGTIPDIGAIRFEVDGTDYDWEEIIVKSPAWKPPRVKE